MAGPVTAIHVLGRATSKGVDARHEAGHDGEDGIPGARVREGNPPQPPLCSLSRPMLSLTAEPGAPGSGASEPLT